MPASDGGSSIIGYTVYQGTSPGGGSGTAVNKSLVTSPFTVTGLKNGTTYYFTVAAVNGVGEGQLSNEVPATPTATPPGEPTGLTATASDGTVTLAWTGPDGGLPIRGYNVYEGTSPGGESGTPVNGSSLVTATSYQVTGLTNGTTYYFMVTAFNRTGQGPTSNEANAVPVTVPGAPTGLTATPGDGTVTLAWAAPASDGGSPVTGYNVYQGTSPGGESGTPVNGSSLVTATSYQVTGLINGTTYYFMGDRVQPGRSGADVERGECRPGDRAGGAHRADRDSG